MKLKLFAVSFAVALAGFSLHWYLQRPGPRPPLLRVGPETFVTAQLRPEQLRALRGAGIQTIIDLRPNDEAADQPSSLAMEIAARPLRLQFRYVPTPHGEIPDAVVEELRDALARTPLGQVLYCRTGRRAVRVFALAEASRPDGPSLDGILAMARGAGFPADDLRDSITQRIARRDAVAEKRPKP